MTPSNPIAPQLEGLVTRQEVLEAHGWKGSTLSYWVKIGILAPAVTIGQKTFWKMPSKEEAEAIAAEMKRRHLAASTAGGYATRRAEPRPKPVKPERQRKPANRTSDAPKGLLSTPQMIETLGIPRETLKRWHKKGYISPVWTCPKFQTNFWKPMSASQVEEIRERTRLSQGKKPKAKTEEALKPELEKKLSPKPAPLKEKVIYQGSGFPYEDAIAKGQANPAWANIIGFNLLRDGNTYKAVAVGGWHSAPWEYCERHFWREGRWEVRLMRPSSGEVLT